MASTTPSTALSRSASSKTIKGDLPPNSIVNFFSWNEVDWIIFFPTSVEPVNAIFFVSGWDVMISPVLASPVIILITPFGILAFWHNSAKYKAVKDVNSAGFKTTVFPAAIAGAIFHANISKGKFQGIIWPTTPIGFSIFVQIFFAQPAW